MIHIQKGLYVTISQLEGSNAPNPLPLLNGFSTNKAYQVLGIYSPSETSEGYFILSNDNDEIWFISNRHLRTYRLIPDCDDFRLNL